MLIRRHSLDHDANYKTWRGGVIDPDRADVIYRTHIQAIRHSIWVGDDLKMSVPVFGEGMRVPADGRFARSQDQPGK